MKHTYHSLNALMVQSKNCPFGVHTKFELKNIKTMPHKNGIWHGMFRQRSVPILSNVTATFFSSNIAITPNGNFCIVPLLHSVSDLTFAAVHEEQFYVDPSVYGLYLLPLPVGTLLHSTGLNQRPAYTRPVAQLHLVSLYGTCAK